MNQATDINMVARKELEDKNLKLMSIEMNFETVSQICAAEKEKNFRLQDKLAEFEFKYEQLYEEMSRNQLKVQAIEGSNKSMQNVSEYNLKLEKEVGTLKNKFEKAQRDINIKSLDVINLEKELNNLKTSLNDTEKELNIKEK
jgi:predicted  nucleic acid-binding Zn-ribbon protein